MSRVIEINNKIQDEDPVVKLLGVSSGFVMGIFFLLVMGLETANINYIELFNGNITYQGDPSVLWLGIFVLSATILLSIQFRLQEDEEEEDGQNINY